jgi:hypothetical protein
MTGRGIVELRRHDGPEQQARMAAAGRMVMHLRLHGVSSRFVRIRARRHHER